MSNCHVAMGLASPPIDQISFGHVALVWKLDLLGGDMVDPELSSCSQAMVAIDNILLTVYVDKLYRVLDTIGGDIILESTKVRGAI